MAYRRAFVALAGLAAVAGVKVGDLVPDILLDLGFPPEKIPGYKENADALKAVGVDSVLIYAVNDGAVMDAWAKDQGVDNHDLIKLVGDTRMELTNHFGLVLDHPGPMAKLGNNRCQRNSMLVDNGVIKAINIAAYGDDPAGDDRPEATLAEKMLEDIRSQGKLEL